MKIKVIHNPLKEWTRKTASEVRKLLRGTHEIVEKGADVTICIGGDGTIFYANHQKRLEGVILGIGSKSSYICQLRRDNWKRKLYGKLNEKTDKVPILEYYVGGKKGTAINDAVVHTKDYRVVEIFADVDGKKSSFYGDGLIVSSAIGSSCYSYSAGGKKYPPGSPGVRWGEADKRPRNVPPLPVRGFPPAA